MSYKTNASANRDALFGPAGGGGGGSKKKKGASDASNRDAVLGKAASGGSGGGAIKQSSSRPAASSKSSTPAPAPSTSKGYQYGARDKKKAPIKPSLSGEAKAAKMREADEYRDKAKKAMTRGLFSKPDPLAASTYYKRASDCYQICGEVRLERLCRMNSAECQMAVGAFATAAAEYTRAAELVQQADDETIEMKREVGRKLHLNAAEAWRSMNEPSKAASSNVQAALALIWGDESSLLPKVALEAIEEAIESFVPDPLNPYARYRQTGNSSFINPDSDETVAKPSAETLELAKNHLVDRPYSHEPVQEIIYLLVNHGEYASALYAAGAATTLLAQDGCSSISLARAFIVETILSLAMGDPIAAEENFLNRHVQVSSYLQSRECKLAEELYRAVKMRDGEALEEARSISGSNKAGINNLHESMRELLTMIRLSGVARKGVPETYSKPKESKSKSGSSKSKSSKEGASKSSKESSSKNSKAGIPSQSQEPSLDELAGQKTGYEGDFDQDVEVAANIDTAALQDELDALDFGDDESDLDDDDLDLR